eukprot:m.20762 g.20762  ORF g.20762 m.20762 type:complete len:283 (+) comp28078_c0_seq4:11-859(+)
MDDKVTRKETITLAKRIHGMWHRIAQTIQPEPYKDYEISAFRKPYEEGQDHAQNFLNAWTQKHHLRATRRLLITALMEQDKKEYAVDVFGQGMISAWEGEQAGCSADSGSRDASQGGRAGDSETKSSSTTIIHKTVYQGNVGIAISGMEVSRGNANFSSGQLSEKPVRQMPAEETSGRTDIEKISPGPEIDGSEVTDQQIQDLKTELFENNDELVDFGRALLDCSYTSIKQLIDSSRMVSVNFETITQKWKAKETHPTIKKLMKVLKKLGKEGVASKILTIK